jgi:hypothetical protein
MTQPSKRKNNFAELSSCCTECGKPGQLIDTLNCVICEQAFHANCCDLSIDLSESDIKLLNTVGWMCRGCLEGAKSAFDQLQARQASMSDQLVEISERLNRLEKGKHFDHSSGQVGVGSLSGGPASSGISTDQFPTLSSSQTFTYAGATSAAPLTVNLIEKTVKNLARKRFNVAISGLAETGTAQGDVALFVDLCVNFLALRPVPVKAARLGRAPPVVDARPRLLLVTLNNEHEASEILANARRLREADDPTVKNYVYINRDLTKEESRIAFERRVARRGAAANPQVTMETAPPHHADNNTRDVIVTNNTAMGESSSSPTSEWGADGSVALGPSSAASLEAVSGGSGNGGGTAGGSSLGTRIADGIVERGALVVDATDRTVVAGAALGQHGRVEGGTNNVVGGGFRGQGAVAGRVAWQGAAAGGIVRQGPASGAVTKTNTVLSSATASCSYGGSVAYGGAAVLGGRPAPGS